MRLLELRGGNRFLFEVMPDRFPWGYLTELETALWVRYYQENPKKYFF